jgi:hypothetical protein
MNGSIYLISSKNSDSVYIGRTSASITKRWNEHNSAYNLFKNKAYRYYSVFDILEYGEKVQGIVEIKADDLKQYTYSLGNMRSFEGGYNLYFQQNNSSFSTLDLLEKNKIERKETEKKLYHLLTNTKTFFVNNIQFYDYNHCIELYFGK